MRISFKNYSLVSVAHWPPATGGWTRLDGSLELHGDPRDESGVHKTADLAVDGARLAVDHEQRLVGGRDHVVTEDSGRRYRAVGVAPLRQRLRHRFSHARDHFHFACGQGERKKKQKQKLNN